YHLHGGGLPRPIGTQKAETFPFPDLEVDTVHRRELLETLCQISSDNDGFDHGFKKIPLQRGVGGILKFARAITKIGPTPVHNGRLRRTRNPCSSAWHPPRRAFPPPRSLSILLHAPRSWKQKGARHCATRTSRE